MSDVDRLLKLANDFYRQAQKANDRVIKRAHMNKGNRFRKKAESLQQARSVKETAAPASGTKT